jgi:hypothetical protein
MSLNSYIESKNITHRGYFLLGLLPLGLAKAPSYQH